jgi:hypothetical protein
MTEMSANREFVSPKTKIDRPLNAYMLFSLENREQVAKENPELKNKEISKILCQKWRELLKPIKDSFKKRALQIKEKHKEENPGIHYILYKFRIFVNNNHFFRLLSENLISQEERKTKIKTITQRS